MANYGQLSYGSKGSEVKTLQELLKNNGYSDLAVDGDFGVKTQAAVRDYQQKNGLAVDGIVGTNTWSSLTAAPAGTTSTPTENNSTGTTSNAYTYEPYSPSDEVTQANTYYQEMKNNKPGEFQSSWDGELKDIIAQILNRDKFTYDLNGDMLYQQYKDQYINQGKMAMMDTIGQAAAMTGGYGNSYAQSVGQQAYQGYLQQLNDKVPEFYGLALDQYTKEGQELYDQASFLAGMEEQEYSRYMDQLTNYYTELGLARDDARYLAEQEHSKWADERDFGYGMWRDSVSDEQRQQEFDFAKKQYDDAMAQSSGGGGGSGGSGGSGGRGNTEADVANALDKIPDSLWVELVEYAESGASIEQWAGYLQRLVDRGEISEEQALILLDRFDNHNNVHPETYDGME